MVWQCAHIWFVVLLRPVAWLCGHQAVLIHFPGLFKMGDESMALHQGLHAHTHPFGCVGRCNRNIC